MNRKIIMTIIGLCTFLTGGTMVLACKCMSSKSLSDNFNFSDSTFIGKVINIEKIGRHNKIIFEIKETFKGNNSTTKYIQTSIDSATCGFDFKKKGEYVVFSKKDEYGIETTGLCSGTSDLNSIKDKLPELSKIKKEYNSKYIFELVEGSTCEVATDGCNNLFINDGKISSSTVIYCPDHTPKYSCTKHIEKSQNSFNMNACKTWTDGCNTFSKQEDGNVISTQAYCPKEGLKPLKCIDKENKKYSKEEFIKKNSETCKVASDGINTFVNVDGEFIIRTKVGYPDNYKAEWTCEKKKDKKDSVVCTKEYNPVCGIDGKTYGNACTVHDVTIAYEGKCKITKNGEISSKEDFKKSDSYIWSKAFYMYIDPTDLGISDNDYNKYESYANDLGEKNVILINKAFNKYLKRINKLNFSYKLNKVQKTLNRTDKAISDLPLKYSSDKVLPKINFIYKVLEVLKGRLEIQSKLYTYGIKNSNHVKDCDGSNSLEQCKK